MAASSSHSHTHGSASPLSDLSSSSSSSSTSTLSSAASSRASSSSRMMSGATSTSTVSSSASSFFSGKPVASSGSGTSVKITKVVRAVPVKTTTVATKATTTPRPVVNIKGKGKATTTTTTTTTSTMPTRKRRSPSPAAEPSKAKQRRIQSRSSSHSSVSSSSSPPPQPSRLKPGTSRKTTRSSRQALKSYYDLVDDDDDLPSCSSAANGIYRTTSITAFASNSTSYSTRSRSTSAFPGGSTNDMIDVDEPIPRDVSIDEPYADPEGKLLWSEKVVKNLSPKHYESYFRNPDDPSDTSFELKVDENGQKEFPFEALEFPNNDAYDRYALLAPKDHDHYNPFMDLELSLHTICRYYLWPEAQAQLGWDDSDMFLNGGDSSSGDSPSRPRSRALTPPVLSARGSVKPSSSSSSLLLPPPTATTTSSERGDSERLESKSPSPVPERIIEKKDAFSTLMNYKDSDSESGSESDSSLSALSSSPPPETPASAYLPPTTSTPPAQTPQVNLLRQLKRAINTRHGPLFLSTLASINTLLRKFKYSSCPLDPDEDAFSDTPSPPPRGPTALAGVVKQWDGHGLPSAVCLRIMEECYQRAVGPHVRTLRHYAAWGSEVYGELTPRFVSELVRLGGLGPGKLFMDLGSGVGNVVLQAALESGCRAYGIEVNNAPAGIARGHVEQWGLRCKMWGVRAGEVELEEGSFLDSKRVDELIGQVDVVLVNNKVFTEELNEALRPKFLDLKEGAKLISLRPFVAPSARLTARNVDDMSAIFHVEERAYHSGHVSWGSAGGSYFVHTVDRQGYAADREKLERGRGLGRRGVVKYTPSSYDD